ncbi:MAG: hypothetical protein H6662_06340 [Ardenticatenaceae bacterium]|nr:hypothetical protein [Ardenticatenaceae bacterium]MCB9004256.1 hypothetical protein [Ardenticatenaceae bacterium]
MLNVIAILLGALLGGLTLAALFTTLVYLLPNRVSRASRALEQAPGRAFLLGLVNALFFGVLGLLFSQGGDLGRLLGVLIFLVLLAGTAVGLSGAVLLLRGRVYPQLDNLHGTLKTAVLLIAAVLAPVVGWFILTPILLLISLGAALMGWHNPKQAFLHSVE